MDQYFGTTPCWVVVSAWWVARGFREMVEVDGGGGGRVGCFLFFRLARLGVVVVVVGQHILYWLEVFSKGPGVPITRGREDRL